ncbi:hypothetical protein ACWEPC_00060 [Nonomuraea sp. NPDC004297]
MTPEEKRAWVTAVVTPVAYLTYVVIILGRAGDVPLAEVPYAATLLWTVGCAVVAAIVLHIAVTVLSSDPTGRKDRRDREIHRHGEYVGRGLLVAGAVAALALALAEADHFYIANVLYLAFVLATAVGSVLKIIAYRRGLPAW